MMLGIHQSSEVGLMDRKVTLWGGIGEKNSNNNTQYYIQNRIYDSEGLCPSLTAFKSDYWIVIKNRGDKFDD
jgi:hypothetical protein